MKKMETQTERIQRIREERNADICRDFKGYYHEGVSLVSRIFAQLASKYGMTAQGVEKVVRLSGLYNGKPGRKKVKRTTIN
jgi:hypothetical protein